MRRLLLPALALLLALSGCGVRMPTDDAYHPETDCAYYLTSAVNGNRAAEGSTGCYLLMGDYLMFIDEETTETIPLCAKPNCLHDRETDEAMRESCEAFFPGAQTLLCGSGGYLYVCCGVRGYGNAGKRELIRMKEDGSGRRTVYTFTAALNPCMCIHRGVFYYCVEGYSAEMDSSAVIMAKSLTHSGEEAKVLYAAPETAATGSRLSALTAYGSRLYFREKLDDDLHYTVRIVDLKNGTVHTPEMPEEVGYIDRPLILNGQLMLPGLIFPEGYPASGEEPQYRLMAFELDGRGMRLLSDAPYCVVSCDTENLYYYAPPVGKREDYLHVCSAALEELGYVPLSGVTHDGVSIRLEHFFPMRGKRLLLEVLPEGGGRALYGFDRADFGKETIVPYEILP